MQAPRVTVFNGQNASINISTIQFFLTGININFAGDQMFFTPTNTGINVGVNLNVTPVVTADRRFVRLSLNPTLTNLVSADVPLIPIQIPVPQRFQDNLTTNQPVIFQMFFQQPTFESINVATTVMVPDGGTVLLGGLKTMNEGRNEFGPPFLSKIPYINRLYKNVAYGRDAKSLMIMVTPRIIINEEEEQIFLGIIPPLPRP
jgi:type II secretory pathway component GspD/PulD (secretin)